MPAAQPCVSRARIIIRSLSACAALLCWEMPAMRQMHPGGWHCGRQVELLSASHGSNARKIAAEPNFFSRIR